MSLPFLKKIDNYSDSEPSSYSFIHPSAIPYDRPGLRLINRLRWDRQNIAPELDTLFRYYRNTCCLVKKTQGFESAKSAETYEEIGQLLAKMWSMAPSRPASYEQLTKVKRLNYYSRGASL